MTDVFAIEESLDLSDGVPVVENEQDYGSENEVNHCSRG